MNNTRDIILEFLNSLWGRRWYAIAVTWLVCLVGWGVVATLPDQYEVSSQVYIDTSSVLHPLLRGIAVEPNVDDEVRLMKQTLLSRGNVEKVMRMTDLDLEATTEAEKNRLISLLQGKTRISAGTGGQNLFSINFVYTNPVQARDVVQAFTTVFVENNIGENRDDSETAREFLAEQTQFYRTQLEEHEKKLADFSREYGELLPASTGNIVGHFRSTEQALNEAILARDELKRQLSTISPFIETSEGAAFGEGPPGFDEVQIAEMEANLESLLAQYTENYPDVVLAKRRLKTLKERVEAARARFASAPSEEAKEVSVYREANPVYGTLKIELVQSEANIGVLRQRFEKAKEQWEQIRHSTDMAPVLAAEQKKLERDYGVVKLKYEQLLERQEAMNISTERSIKSDDVKFRIIEPPIVPLKPAGPNRALFLSAVLLFGLATGVASAALLVITRETFQNIRALRSSFSIPVYGAVRDLKTGLRRGKLYLDFFATSLAGGSLVAVYLLLLQLESRLGLANIASLENAPQSLEQIMQIFDGRV